MFRDLKDAELFKKSSAGMRVNVSRTLLSLEVKHLSIEVSSIDPFNARNINTARAEMDDDDFMEQLDLAYAPSYPARPKTRGIQRKEA